MAADTEKDLKHKALETIRGLSANVQVLINVIENPNGGNGIAKMGVLLVAKNTFKEADEFVALYNKSQKNIAELLPCRLEYDKNGAIIWAVTRHGKCMFANIRGHGFLTGKGSGALGLDEETANKIQDDWGEKICDLWNELLPPDLLQDKS